VPLTMTLKLAMENEQRTQWIAILLGSEAAAEALLPHVEKAKDVTQPKPSPSSSDDV
jgi:uracil DNA glycosylase